MSDQEKDAKEPLEAKPKAVSSEKPKVKPRRPRPQVQKEPEEPQEPSPKEPLLQNYVKWISEKVGQEAIEESYVNRKSDDLPTLVVKKDFWPQVAKQLKEDKRMLFVYPENFSAVDYETHLEVVCHLFSFEHNERIAIRIKTDREEAKVPSVTHIWEAANWNEREMYDLMGIHFTGHPNLKRILMPDDWVGHPLRKDYVPLDKEV